jgi:hypothetical protein
MLLMAFSTIGDIRAAVICRANFAAAWCSPTCAETLLKSGSQAAARRVYLGVISPTAGRHQAGDEVPYLPFAAGVGFTALVHRFYR